MRRFLYGRWFFFFLAVVCLVDLGADVLELVRGNTDLNDLAIAMDCIAVAMSLWIFTDLQRRRPKNGDHSRRR